MSLKSTDVLIIGGSAAGLTAANSVHTWYPNKKVTIVRNVPYTVVPCGIPYIYGYMNAVEKDKIPDGGFVEKGFEFIIGNVIDVDRKKKIARFDDGSEMSYDKLLIGVGSNPILPPIDGVHLNNVFPIRKDPNFLEKIMQSLEQAKNVIIIGGGFIGVEMAEQVRLKGDYNVTLIEGLHHCLQVTCETDAGIRVREELEKMGVKVLTDVMVNAISGADTVESVTLSTGEIIKADMVILGIGAAPNIELAQKIGLEVDVSMGIKVDEYMRTSDSDIFACGDCATKISKITGELAPIRLASVACSEGMIAGSNMFELKRKTQGSVGAFATKVGDVSIASAGLTEKMCADNGIDYYTGEITSPDRHPGSLPGCTMQTQVRVLFDSKNDQIIGGHVIGGMQAQLMRWYLYNMQLIHCLRDHRWSIRLCGQ